MMPWTPPESLSESGRAAPPPAPARRPDRAPPAASWGRQLAIYPPAEQPAVDGPSPAGAMTYSASCPSFSGVYELSAGSDELLRALTAGGDAGDRAVHGGQSAGNLMAAMQDASGPALALAHQELGLQPAGLHLAEEPLELDQQHQQQHHHGADFLPDKSYDFLLQFQQEQLGQTQRMFPHQQLIHDDVDGALMSPHAGSGQPKRGFHGSASFTNLSSMEAELQRRQNGVDDRFSWLEPPWSVV